MGKPIPDGYSYRRCDRFTRDEFLEMFPGESPWSLRKEALKYVDEHPKDVYTTDDEVAVRSGRSTIRVHGNSTVYGGYSTKRYAFDESATGERNG